MSLFDFPRIHFSGRCTLNPGTANNDDYSGQYSCPVTGENLALINSAKVMPRTFGKTDEKFVDWIQQPHDFIERHAPNDADPATAQDAPPDGDTPAKTKTIVPAEWNYYGDMRMNVTAPVTGAQMDPGARLSADAADDLSALVGQDLYFDGNITDVNSEGSPPGTQFFIDAPTLGLGDTILGGTPNKAGCQWINFLRNVNMVADGGAGGYMYHVIEGAHKGLPGFGMPGVTGIVLRYYLFARHGGASAPEDIAKLYQSKQINPADLQITGTIAPYYGTETLRTGPVGRLLTCDTPVIEVDKCLNNNLADGKNVTMIPLAPAVLAVSRTRISIDAIGTFPEERQKCAGDDWSDPDVSNPKYDFKGVSLVIEDGAGQQLSVAQIDYADTKAGNAKGWIYDIDIADRADVQSYLADPESRFALVNEKFGTVLSEDDYYVTTNAQAIYAEQGAEDTTHFRNQGAALETVSFDVFHLGSPMDAGTDTAKVWMYRTTPLGYASDKCLLDGAYVPGTPLSIPNKTSGTFLMTLQVGDAPELPTAYGPASQPGAYIGPPFTTLTNTTGMSLRVLPNEDFAEYLTGPADAPVGNDNLTFEVLYEHVLKNYALLFPAMDQYFELGNEAAVQSAKGSILARTDPNIWHTPRYMPITRDLSDSRRTLLQAWCRKG